MALNFSHLPIFPAYVPEDNRVSGSGGGSLERDIHDILPDDPFGMDMDMDMDITSMVSALTGWLEGLVVSKNGLYQGEEGVVDEGDYCSFYGEVDICWDTPMVDVQNENEMYTFDRFDWLATLDRSVGSNGGTSYDCVYMGDEIFDCGDCSVYENKNVLNENDDTMFWVNRLDGFAAFDHSVDIGGGIRDGCFPTNDVVFGCGDGYAHEIQNENPMFRDDRLDGFSSIATLDLPVDSGGDGGFCYGRFSAEDVVSGCGDRDDYLHENSNVLNKNDSTMFMVNRLDEFVTLDLSNASADGSGCFSAEDVVFGYGDVCVHENESVTSHDSIGVTMFMCNRFDEFAAEDALGHFVDFVDKDAVHHGWEAMKDVKFGCSASGVGGNKNDEAFSRIVDDVDDDGSPHMALSFALAYLDIHDLLIVEQVCKSLRQTVQNDPLLWKHIQIDQPLNDRITDDALLQLTSRAQGHLQYLSLVECKVVTDDGLRRVLENNPRLTKLGVPGCIKISTEGLTTCLQMFQPVAVTGIDCIRIGGHSVTVEQFEELNSLLSINKPIQPHCRKPHYFNRQNAYVPLDDERSIDIELCPKCEKLKLVYDCHAESCPAADQAAQSCRACLACIPRCERCGRCVSNVPHMETFTLGYVCTDCAPDNGANTSSRHVISSEIDG